MNLGFNSNVPVGDAVYHVQTEARGLTHPFVDTVVLSAGRVLHRRSTSYADLLAGGAADEDVLRSRVEQQHRDILEGLREGSLLLEESGLATAAAIDVKLRNPTSWLAAGQASLEIEVCARPSGEPVAGAEVEVTIEGAEGARVDFAAQTDARGRALVRFQLPRVADPAKAALVIRARGAQAQDHLRYRLKPKPGEPEPAQ
jgi:hypothetical protein